MNTSAALPVLRSTQVQSMVGGESSETEWGKNIARVTEFAQEQAGEFASQYNETDWFPVARDALSHYMEVRALSGVSGCTEVGIFWHQRLSLLRKGEFTGIFCFINDWLVNNWLPAVLH